MSKQDLIFFSFPLLSLKEGSILRLVDRQWLLDNNWDEDFIVQVERANSRLVVKHISESFVRVISEYTDSECTIRGLEKAIAEGAFIIEPTEKFTRIQLLDL